MFMLLNTDNNHGGKIYNYDIFATLFYIVYKYKKHQEYMSIPIKNSIHFLSSSSILLRYPYIIYNIKNEIYSNSPPYAYA